MKYFNDNDFLGDCCILQSFLEEMRFYSGSERLRVLKHSNNSGNIGSMLYGYTWKGYLSPTKKRTAAPWKGLFETKCMDLYPEFGEVAREFADLYFPTFKWCNLQLNKNFPIPPHFDSTNVGTSIIIGLGDYRGGKLFVDFAEDGGIREFDIRGEMVKFDGSKYRHWVSDIEGDRYSVVFFNNRVIEKKMTGYNSVSASGVNNADAVP